MLDNEPDWGATVTEDQKRAIIEFTNAYAKKHTPSESESPTKRTFDIADDDDEDDVDDDEDPMSSSDAWSDWLALSGGQAPWRRSGKGGLPNRLMGGQRFMMSQAHSEPSGSADVSPSRSGSPMLKMAAKGVVTNQDVLDTPLKPKLAAVAASRAVEFDIYIFSAFGNRYLHES